ncbi:ImmA/IrrE family metallo-endopeptidase [Paenibacillus sp. RUD330]|nr:ImmA/IrrE family metallo-endopeptidase [Paenibacillus sp. RUD330]
MLDDLLAESQAENVQVVEYPFKTIRLKGLYCDGVITINQAAKLNTVEKTCVIAEELGHHHTTQGVILDQSKILHRQKERLARQWAYERLVPLERFVDVFHARIKEKHEVAEFLGVTEAFLLDLIARYKEIYGQFAFINNRYIVSFEPLSVIEILNWEE